MMSPALSPFTELLSPAAGTVAGSAEAGAEGSPEGGVFNQIMVTMLPAEALPATPLSVSDAMPATLSAALPASDGLSLLLPGLSLGETGKEAGSAEVLTDEDAATAALAPDALLPDWLPAMPATLLPLAATAPAAVAGGLPGMAEGTAARPAAAMASAGTLATMLRRGTAAPETFALPAGAAGSEGAAVALPGLSGEQRSAVADLASARTAEQTQPQAAALLPRAFMARSGQDAASPVPAWSLAAVSSDPLARARDAIGLQMLQGGGEPGQVGMTGQSFPLMAGRDVTVITMPQHALQSPDWGDAFNQHLVTLARQGSQTASMQLNPEHLGPIEIKVTVNDKAASIEFASRHSSTSDLIEAAMPRLAGALEAHGLRLDEARVSQLPARAEGFAAGLAMQHQGSDARGQAGAGQASPSARGGAADADQPDAQGAPQRQPRADDGRIDYYA